MLSFSGTFVGPDTSVGMSKRTHEEPDSSPGSPAPLSIVESPEPSDHQQQKRQRVNEVDEH